MQTSGKKESGFEGRGENPFWKKGPCTIAQAEILKRAGLILGVKVDASDPGSEVENNFYNLKPGEEVFVYAYTSTLETSKAFDKKVAEIEVEEAKKAGEGK